MSEWRETEIGKIPSGWELGSFEEDLNIQGRIGWKGYKTSDLVEEGPLVVGGTEIKSNIFLNLVEAQHLSREKYEESPEIMLKEGDVLLVTRGNLGEVGYYHSGYGEGTINPSVIILNKFRGNSKFLFYYLISRQGNYQVMSLQSGSSIPAIYQSAVKTMKYPKPKLNEQNKIVEVLYNLDKKITLLRKQNQTLEELAQTLFKRWFVEFEFPDENGRPYKSTGGKMVESELGEIPEGWRVGTIKDFGKIVCGKTPSKQNSSFYGNDVPFLKIPDMHGVVYPLKTIDNLSNEGSNSQINKLIPAKSIIVSCIATVGLVCINPYDCHTNQQINSVVLEKEYSRYYLYHCLKRMKSVLENIGSGGSATLNVNTSVFSNIEIIVPSYEITRVHYSLINPIFEKLLTNQEEIQTLTQLRDTLLPKLMSGEVRVKI